MSVFLADIDDYLSPGAACVNPLFSADSSSAAGATATAAPTRRKKRRPTRAPTVAQGGSAFAHHEKANDSSGALLFSEPTIRLELEREEVDNEGESGSIRAQPPTASSRKGIEQEEDKAASVRLSADIADCLACSGCVTTAETVLLREHSAEKYRRLASPDQEEPLISLPPLVITLSPASAAELLRRLLAKEKEEKDAGAQPERLRQQKQLRYFLRKLASILCRQLHASAVLDGTLALQWSLQQSAMEFCDRYQSYQEHHDDDYHQATATATATDPASALVSSSCPALVCLAEKALHNSLPSLSRVKSPLACAGAYLLGEVHGKTDLENGQGNPAQRASRPVRHVAIMPCHDKKLEATRSDVAPTVDLVLTTSEAWELLVESVGTTGAAATEEMRKNPSNCHDHPYLNLESTSTPEQRLRALFQHIEPAAVDAVRVSARSEFTPRRREVISSSWITCAEEEEPANCAAAAPSEGCQPSMPPLTYTSGGYADYIFRYAAQYLFGARVDRVEWRPNNAAAAATAASAAMTKSNSRSTIEGNADREGALQQVQRQRRTTSARVAAARREVLEAALYRHAYQYRRVLLPSVSGDCRKGDLPATAEAVVAILYSCEAEPPDPAVSSPLSPLPHRGEEMTVSTTPVLRFAMAHGFQAMERAIVAAASGSASPEHHLRRYHYVEAMACPSGCVNGGGQIPMGLSGGNTSLSSSRRETPTESRVRITSALRHLPLPVPGAIPLPRASPYEPTDNEDVDHGSDGGSSSLRATESEDGELFRGPAASSHHHCHRRHHYRHPHRREDLLRTSYQAVQPLEFRSGATKGMAVKDMQW
jgi:iron only hydrogenase large subunit-like protein